MDIFTDLNIFDSFLGLSVPSAAPSLECCRRPNFGSDGKQILLKANHIPITIPKGSIHHYDVSIQPEKCPRRLNRDIVDTMVNQYSTSIFARTLPVYDGKSNLYTRKPIRIGKGAIDIDVIFPGERKERVFRVRIGWKTEISLDRLQEALEGRARQIPSNAINDLVSKRVH